MLVHLEDLPSCSSLTSPMAGFHAFCLLESCFHWEGKCVSEWPCVVGTLTFPKPSAGLQSQELFVTGQEQARSTFSAFFRMNRQLYPQKKMSSRHSFLFHQNVLNVFACSWLYQGGHTALSVMGKTEKVNNLHSLMKAMLGLRAEYYGRPEDGFSHPGGQGSFLEAEF